MKIWNKSLLCQNNKGSAIINVVIAMLFIIALGSALLYTTYIRYSVSVSARTEKGNFYNAESEMNRMLTGIHKFLSDSLVSAYTDTLTDYATGTLSSPQATLNENLINELIASTVTVGNGTAAFITEDINGNLYYSVYALSSFLDGNLESYDGTKATVTKDGNTIELSGDKEGKYIVTQTFDSKGIGYLTLKDVNLSFKSSNDYLATIKTDIKINIPEFFTASASSADVGDYAIIAEDGIMQTTGTGTPLITGNVFTDGTGIITNGTGNVITFSGNVCAKGGIKVENGAKLIFNTPEKELWTDEITLGEGEEAGSITLDGKIYVANDLLFNGKKSSAFLSGEYYGFGSGNAPNESSAILVNAQESTLDMSKLNRLSLAGVSYIEFKKEDGLTRDGVDYTTPIIMGESITTKADQLVYLLPPECMTNYYTNPCILDDDNSNPPDGKIPPKFNPDTVLWSINGVDKTLKYYLGDGNEKGEVISLYSSIDGSNTNKMAYVFIVFSDLSAANEYFKDYFTTYPERIEQYTDLYLKINGKASKISAAGNTFYSADGDKLSLYPADPTVLTGNMSTRYKNKVSPLDKFIYRDKLDVLSGTLVFYNDEGKDIAVVLNSSDDLLYGSTYSDPDQSVKLIVAKGDVSISANFTGIIIAGGTVSIDGTSTYITAAPIDPNILSAKTSDEKYTLSDFVRGSSGSGNENIWDVTNLVVYDNWKKN